MPFLTPYPIWYRRCQLPLFHGCRFTCILIQVQPWLLYYIASCLLLFSTPAACTFSFCFQVVPSSPSHVASPSLKFKVLIASLCPSQVVAWRIIIPPQPISSFTQHAATLYKTKDNDSTSLLADGDGATGIAKFQECPIVFKSSSSTIRIHVLWLVFFQPGIAGAAAINSWHRLSFPLSLLVVVRHSPCQKCEVGGEHGDQHQSRTDSEFVVCHSLMGGRPWTMEHSAKQVGSPCSWLEGIYG